MQKSTLVFLLLLVIGLAALWLARERERIAGGPALAEYPLCPELSSERVAALRVDHLARAFQIKFERDQAGTWFMTDPVPYPAQSALVRTLLASLENARGEPAPEADPGQVGLDPPAVVIEIVQLDAGEKRTIRIELGRSDLDSSRIYARVPGHPSALAAGGGDVFRTSRTLANTLERFPDDYRDRRATGLRPQDVVGFRRKGLVYLEEEKRRVDLTFEALLGPDGWKSATPEVSLDPTAMGLLVRGGTELSILGFADDSPQDLAIWGLDPPRFTVELQPLSGTPVVLAFGSPSSPLDPSAQDQRIADEPIASLRWFCQRQGYAHVWEVGTREVQLLTRPADLFYDQLVVRMLRTDVARLELQGAGKRRILAREAQGWSVWEESADGTTSAPTPGNAEVIEEALAQLERIQLAEHLPEERFEPLDPAASFAVQLKGGARLGGALGRATRDPKSGAQGRQYLRNGDEVVALIENEVLDLCTRPLEEFRSRKVHQFLESTVRAIELEHHPEGTTYSFLNDGDNSWSPRGKTIRAPDDFVQSLDGLLNLAAQRWLPDAPEYRKVLSVRLIPLRGEPLAFVFGRSSGETVVCATANGQLAEVDGAVLERLLRLF